MMRTFYNGYCFAYNKETYIYNPTLALYFLEQFQETCQYPREMLDENLAMDRGKITYIWANELTIKTVFLTLLFNDIFYIMDSEPSLERDYADLIMILRSDMRQYQLLDMLIEFKYVSLKDVDLSGEQVKQLTVEKLKALTPVRQKLAKSKSKLEDYQQALKSTYGDVLRLHTYSVVAVGFDRLVWTEVVS